MKTEHVLPDDGKRTQQRTTEVMAMAINKVIVIGNLGANPVIRALPNSGQNVANFSVATTERFTDRNGAKQERTDWHRIVAFGRLADTCERFLTNGRQVYVEGRLTTRRHGLKATVQVFAARCCCLHGAYMAVQLQLWRSVKYLILLVELT